MALSGRPKYPLQKFPSASPSYLSMLFICSAFLALILLFWASFPFLSPTSTSDNKIQFSRPDLDNIRSKPKASRCPALPSNLCRYDIGRWVYDSARKPVYSPDCPFQRNAWNCLKNGRPKMNQIFAWKWVPRECHLPQTDPHFFLSSLKNMNIAFVGDSLNENFIVSFLCILRTADQGARKWKRKGAWRGAYFPKFNVTVAYHRAVLLAKYKWQSESVDGYALPPGSKGFYRVDIDVPADDWINILDFYDIFVFNTGHWWNTDKFPKESPLIFYKNGRMISPRLSMTEGLKLVLWSMTSYIEKMIQKDKLKIWRMQSPRHFYGGDWNQNGSCTFDKLLEMNELDNWFDPKNHGVNKDAREVNAAIKEALIGKSIYQLNLTHLSEYRADAHPAIWLGRRDAVSIWGQDCMHWCLPGVPDTWVDILSAVIVEHIKEKEKCHATF